MTDVHFRDVSAFAELADNLGRKGSVESQGLVSLPQAFPCVSFWVVPSPSFFLSPSLCPLPTLLPSLLPVMHLAALLLLHPLPLPPQFLLPLTLTCLLSAVFSDQFFHLTVLHTSLILYFTRNHDLSILDNNLPVYSLLLSEWIWANSFTPLGLSVLICRREELVYLENRIYV